jgi:hypothetical protein
MPYEAIRPPYEEIRPPYEEIRRPYEEIRRPYEEIRRPYEEIRRPYEEIRRPYEEIRQPYEEIRRPYEEIRRPYEEIRRDVIVAAGPHLRDGDAHCARTQALRAAAALNTRAACATSLIAGTIGPGAASAAIGMAQGWFCPPFRGD